MVWEYLAVAKQVDKNVWYSPGSEETYPKQYTSYDEAGKEGWELVNSFPETKRSYAGAIFKRPSGEQPGRTEWPS